MNVIFQLPDSIANQIAAGEVVQRPASVVKELMENSVDAGATAINVVIYDAGKTLIQVSDNGVGMTDIDARMAFERHATSKIRTAADLFKINTLGFRGEALASIAAISNVTLRTRHKSSELGVSIDVSASTVKAQEVAQCQQGCVISVKNLFFNIPARRKFLKSDQTEFRHITDEFIRVAIINPDIAFTLTHNDQAIFNLPTATLKQRIVAILGRNYSENLISVDCSTSLVNISGFIGNPKLAKKSTGDQYFFANNRYMRHPYFHRAIMNAYEKIIPQGTYPAYFVVMEVDPECIDVNIHPTKTEIKFENENEIFQLLHAAVKESLGKFNFVPSIDFDNQIDIPISFERPSADTPIRMPEIKVNPSYNPFDKTPKYSRQEGWAKYGDKKSTDDWHKILSDFENQSKNQPDTVEFPDDTDIIERSFIQIKKRFILTTVKSGLMLIDQHRAHFQIIYEELKRSYDIGKIPSQPMMFPHTVEVSFKQGMIIDEILPELNSIGFVLKKDEQNNYQVTSVPVVLPISSINAFFETVTEKAQNTGEDIEEKLKTIVLQDLARISSIQYGKDLNIEEMNHITDKLFACQSPNYTVDGRSIVQIISMNDIIQRFNN